MTECLSTRPSLNVNHNDRMTDAQLSLPKPFHPRKNLAGLVFTRLTVIRCVGVTKGRNAVWLCRCSCGNETTVAGGHLVDGGTQSCGCLASENVAERNRKHGLSGSPEFNVWTNIKTRCFNPKSDHAEWYSERGIRMCDRWKNSFVLFRLDMGERPTPAHSIERINNNGHYSCGHCSHCVGMGWTKNCRWATASEQAHNRRNSRWLTINGRIKLISEWAAEHGLWQSTLTRRIERGVSPDKLLLRRLR